MHSRHLVIVPHTHWDREWYMPFERFRKRLVSMIDHLLEVLENDRSFTCFELDGQTILLDDYLEIRPENRKRLEKLIRQGRILIGPWYIQPDEFLVTGESIIRNLRLGIRSAKQFGKPSMIGYLPDQFGHIAQMPQILAGFGIQSAVVWRGVGRTVNQTQFLWESPDGTQLLAIYLADSYSNGAYLPLNPKELHGRLVRLVERLAPFCTTNSLLIMNGLDHLEPQEGLPKQLEKAARRLNGATCEIGSLGTYISQIKQQARSLPIHHGEFRSSERAPLLPGVTSARMKQKQRAFFCCRLLEKYVEPLSTWAALCGDERPYQNYIEHSWRLLLQNQPHDSICGCSVDAVHEEMETRFDRVEQVSKALLKDSLSFLANRLDTRFAAADEPVLCVYNPTSARNQFIDLEVNLEEPDFAVAARDAEENVIPLQKEVGARELFFQMEDTPEAVAQLVSGMESREVMGFFITNVLWRMDGELLRLTLILGRAPAGEVDFQKRRKELLDVLRTSHVGKVKVSGVSGTKTRLGFLAHNLPPHGLAIFSLTNAQAKNGGDDLLRVSPHELENSFYKIAIRNDGTLNIFDKELGKEFPCCLQFVDEGDRGDTYNFDTVPGGDVVDVPTGPVAASVVENGPVRAAVQIRAAYRIPEKLTPDRSARSSAAIETPLTTTVTLYKDLKRIDFRTSFENNAEDHRLRVLFHTPIKASETAIESTFALVRRPAVPEPGDGFVESPAGTSPQKTFACVEDETGGVALFNRGIPEIEAIPRNNGTALALTLLRSVGWLSRDDLCCRPASAGPQFQTPGAQSKGRHLFEFAFTSYSGTCLQAGITQKAHAYAFPPVAALTNRHAGKLKNGLSLVQSDNPDICVSAVELSEKNNAYLVRLYNTTDERQLALLSLFGRISSVHEVNFLEKRNAKEGLKVRSAKVRVNLRPAEIKTLQVHIK